MSPFDERELQKGRRMPRAGIVDEHVEAAECVRDLIDDVGAITGVAQIERASRRGRGGAGSSG